MTRPSLKLLVKPGFDGRVDLLAPAVGYYAGHPRQGAGLRAGSRAGTIHVLGTAFDLLVPENVAGEVAEVYLDHRVDAVAFGDRLFGLATPEASLRSAGLRAADTDSPDQRARTQRPSAAAREGLLPGEHALRATTAGVFYARADPASPPFVSPGSKLEMGQTAGLIEVMKCFSPIVHPGGEIPSPVLVREVRAEEGAEVRPGQILFVLTPDRTP